MNGELHRRAHAAGVLTSYVANDGTNVHASDDTLAALLAALGEDGAPRASSVIVAWDGVLGADVPPGELHLEPTNPAGAAVRFDPATQIPHGYHTLHGDHGAQTTVISAPRLAPTAAPGRWGLFVPLYALRTHDDSALASYSDLGRLHTWQHGFGAEVLLTLPLLPLFLDEPGADWSPYAPVSRRMWSELYVDLDPLDPWGETRAPVGAQIDYPGAYREHVARLDRVAELLWPTSDVQRWLRERPDVQRYAAFRAAQAVHGRNWRTWSSAPGTLPASLDETVRHRHAVGAYLAHTQLHRVVSDIERTGGCLALDVALGAHPDGFDVWSQQDLFVEGMSVGAPPDSLFIGGQDWGFPPVHPRRSSDQAHRYLREVIAHHLRCARVLRLDHVMGLLRQWWIPAGHAATDGAYVTYPLEELLAVVCLEATRAGSVIVGENLGTVPVEINDALREHRLRGIFVHQDIIPTYGRWDHQRPTPQQMAMLSTHDGVPFAGYWAGVDIQRQFDHDLIDAERRDAAMAERVETKRRFVDALRVEGELDGVLDRPRSDGFAPDAPDGGGFDGQHPEHAELARVARAAMVELAGSDADIVIYPLEDLWLETRPQNTPGTWQEVPNWRHTAARSLDDVRGDAAIAATLRAVDAARADAAQRSRTSVAEPDAATADERHRDDAAPWLG